MCEVLQFPAAAIRRQIPITTSTDDIVMKVRLRWLYKAIRDVMANPQNPEYAYVLKGAVTDFLRWYEG